MSFAAFRNSSGVGVSYVCALAGANPVAASAPMAISVKRPDPDFNRVRKVLRLLCCFLEVGFEGRPAAMLAAEH